MRTASLAVDRALAARRAISQFLGPWDSPEFKRLDAEDDLAHTALETVPIRTAEDATAMVGFGRIDAHDLACQAALRRGLDWLNGQASMEKCSSDILTEKEVRDLLRVSRTTLWKLRQEDPAFPKPFNKSPRMLRFYRGDVERYIKEKK